MFDYPCKTSNAGYMSSLILAALVATAGGSRTDEDSELVEFTGNHPITVNGLETTFLRQREFVVFGGKAKFPSGLPRTGWFVLTADHLLVYRCLIDCPKGPAEFNNDHCSYSDKHRPQQLFDIRTVLVGNIFRHRETLDVPGNGPGCERKQQLTVDGLNCLNISGTGYDIDAEDYWFSTTMSICHEHMNTIMEWRHAIERAHLDYHGILGKNLGEKVTDATLKVKIAYVKNEFPELDETLKAPDAFSPLLCPKQSGQPDVTSERPAETFLEPMGKFSAAPPQPFMAGDNSRSGAAFFKSADGSLMVKRIRKFEYVELWKLAQDCSYHQRVVASASLINPIYLAFRSSGQFWMVMRVEGLPEAVSRVLPPAGSPFRKDFFRDLKPGAMTSDRKPFAKQVMQEAMLTDLHMRHTMDEAQTSLQQDINFLENHKLVDYSLLMFGSVIHFDSRDNNSRAYYGDFLDHTIQSLFQAVATHPQCGISCGSREQDLVDISAKLSPNTAAHLQWEGQRYKCCCVELKLGDSARITSPCALVLGTAGCGDSTLLGRGFHSYWRSSVGGRCLVRLGGVPLPDRQHLNSLDPAILADGFNPAAGLLQACAITCVALLDYLLPLSTGRSLENIALLPIYGELKWSNYGEKVTHLFHCLADSIPKVGTMDKSNKMLRHFVNEPWFDAEQAAKRCSDVFPPLEKNVDTKILQRLVALKL